MEAMTIDRVGAQGDGVALGEKGPVFVPFTLPGELVNCAVKGSEGTAIALLMSSPDRIEPVCKHFEHCGGCSTQHWAPKPYLAWKRALVIDALAAKGIEGEVGPTFVCLPGERRRVTFAARGGHDKIIAGFNAARSHDIVEIEP